MVNWLELIEEKEEITLICVISLKLMRTAMFIHGTM